MSKLSIAATDVLAERERQQSVEGWTPEHDAKHGAGELARAAACYLCPWQVVWPARCDNPPRRRGLQWPWERRWWKPKDRRRDLVRAGALVLAEIERLDRLDNKRAASGEFGDAKFGVVI